MPKNFSSVARQVIQYSRRMEFDGELFLNVFKSFFMAIFMDQRKEFKKMGRRRMKDLLKCNKSSFEKNEGIVWIITYRKGTR